MTHVALDSLNTQKNETEEMHCGKTCISSLVVKLLSHYVALDSLKTQKNETEEMHCGKTLISSLVVKLLSQTKVWM